MKHLFSFILVLILAALATAAVAANDVRGRIVNAKGEAVGYATVVAMAGERQAAGTTTDDDGRFSLRVADGRYRVVMEFVGYAAVEREVTVSDDIDMGEVVMNESSTEIDGVVVSAQMIRREADRFVVDVANSPAAIGKDGTEVLQQSPGVWVDDDNISVNGANGTKVYVNEREVKLSGEELVRYIRNLRAEDISKIEVVPQTGADYDADSSGGAVKITLKRRLDNGMMGSVRMYSSHNSMGHDYNPSASVNVRAGMFDLSASGWYSYSRMRFTSNENTRYTAGNAAMTAASEDEGDDSDGGFSLSAVAEITPRHSVGASFDYWRWNDGSVTDSQTEYADAAGGRLSRSRYDNFDLRDNCSATFNYIMKTDTLGSALKFIADYTQRNTAAGSDNSSSITAAGGAADSLYRDRTNSLFRIATANLGYDKVLSEHWTLKAGAKYTYNEINSDAEYRCLAGGGWVPSTVDDYDISYTENIGAAYFIASMKYGRWSAVAGLRGEYTFTEGKGADVDRDYFSLFPNANVSYALDGEGRHSLVAQYSRSISRPGFWSLTPNRRQISDYTYQTGNPMLDPSYSDNFSLTAVVAFKYSVTLGVTVTRDDTEQIVVPDADDPRMLNLTWRNLPTVKGYRLNVNLPFALTKWWDWNVNVMGMLREQQLTEGAEITVHPMAQWSSMMSFKLPCGFFVDWSYFGMTNAVVSNAEVKGMQRMNVAIKKRFGDSWTLTCNVNNVLPCREDITFEQDDFVRRITSKGFYNRTSVRVGLSWNFKSGKAFRARSVESGSADEASRL